MLSAPWSLPLWRERWFRHAQRGQGVQTEGLPAGGLYFVLFIRYISTQTCTQGSVLVQNNTVNTYEQIYQKEQQ